MSAYNKSKSAMRKIIATINLTIDGFCDHTVSLPEEEMHEIHEHYRELLSHGDAILYGRKTYQLMEFWKTLLEKPSEEKSMNDFAVVIDKIPKIVFSNTLKTIDWDTARLSDQTLEEEVLQLKQQSGKAVFVGSRSLILQLMKLNLIDEYQLCVYPIVGGGSLPLFENIHDSTIFKLIKTKIFRGGAIILYYEPRKEKQPSS